MAGGFTALILGATGATGKHLLREILSSDRFTRVGEFGRSLTAEEKLPENHSRLNQKIIDFEKLDSAGLNAGNWDVVFIARRRKVEQKVDFEVEAAPMWERARLAEDPGDVFQRGGNASKERASRRRRSNMGELL